MQFHLNGFQGPGDPLANVFKGQEPDFQTCLPEDVDVLIIGAGPAGQLLAAQLARFSDITTRIIEAKPGPLQQGRADGLQCRTIEIFEAFGFSERVLKEAYWVNETTFWSPKEDGTGLRRSGRIRDTDEGLSEFPHVILNQARMQDFWLEAMKATPTRLEPCYNRKLVDLQIPADQTMPVEVTIEKINTTEQEHVRARYVVGCDGARSIVRQRLGLEMKGDYMNQAWGVLDALVVSDFPDLRLKTAIHSANDGSLLIIPREGGYLVRFYIELDKLQESERISSKNITVESVIARAQRIFNPYTFDVREVAYWSVYEVGQRLTDHFDDVPLTSRATRTPRAFIAGDACHTHSAKAGQGMNVSMNDTFNLGWKLVHVLRGLAQPSLLHTYSDERQKIAQDLIDFDRVFARMWASRPKNASSNASSSSQNNNDKDSVDPALFQSYFAQQGKFTAGLATKYPPGPLTSSPSTSSSLAKGYELGTRFQSDLVLCAADAKPVHLAHVMKADARWRIVMFGPRDPALALSSLSTVCQVLSASLIPRYTPAGEAVDSVIDVRAVLQQSRQSFEMPDLPALLFPRKGKLGLQDYEKVFTDEPSYNFGFGNVFEKRQVDREKGCMVLVRPDQYVSAVVELSEKGVQELIALLDGFMIVRGGVKTGHS